MFFYSFGFCLLLFSAYESNQMPFWWDLFDEPGRCQQFRISRWRSVCVFNGFNGCNCATFRQTKCADANFCRYIRVSTGPGQHFVFAIIKSPEVPKNSIGFSIVQRKWATISVNQDIDVQAFRFNPSSKTEFLHTVTLEVDFFTKKTWVSNDLNEFELFELNFSLNFFWYFF